ncbi:hypothetical protein AMTR_s00085p00097760 [Amborella trichopoda]|uniref:Apyrase n=1 Tax=Amborella trichopoda TaxID=13333 RepID=W1P547_AMBTC|nr:hypothetical protein AMTR_s00085p00097760 [Amborella trichopoda]
MNLCAIIVHISCAHYEGLPILLHSFPDYTKGRSQQSVACEYHCMQTEPGLDKYVSNVSGLAAALEPLLHWAGNIVPSKKHKTTPIFVLATAGLRRLPSEDGSWVLENVEYIINRYGFMHQRSWIRILDGREEAYYGWLAVNYKMGRLGSSLDKPTFGALDLGGSSLEVVLEKGEVEENQHFLRSQIGLVGHNLLAYSLPSYGLNEAFERSLVLLSKEQSLKKSSSGKLELRHPCLNLGYMEKYTCNSCNVMPKANAQLNSSGSSQI